MDKRSASPTPFAARSGGCGAVPVAVWLLAADLLPAATGYAHRYRFRDDQGRGFIDHGAIVLFELNRFAAAEATTEEERWP